MKKTILFGFIAVLALAACTAIQAGSVWNDYDTAAPFAIRYNDADNVGKITVTTNTITLGDGVLTNTITYSASATMNTLGEVMAAINGNTNITGVKNFEAVYWCGIAADTVTNVYLVPLSATTLTKQWSYAVKWDTSTCKHYDSAVGTMVGTVPVNAGKIDRIFGDPIGTGNVQLSVYVNGSRKWSRLITSPIYSHGSLYTNVATETSVAFDFPLNIEVGSQPAFVRAARATTATTGGIGISDSGR